MTTVEPVQPVPARGPRRWLLSCAGANRAVLALCPTEVEKYVGLGSAVLISSVLAALSGTVAFATAAGGGDDLALWMGLCLPLGVIYGAVIFAIDRFLVSSSLNPVTRLATDADNGPRWLGAARRTGEVVRTVGAAVPRLLLATLIGALVAEPVLLVVFRREIDQQVSRMQTLEVEEATERIDGRYDDELDRISTREAELAQLERPVNDAVGELATLDDDIDVVETDLAELQVLLRNEIAGVAVDGESEGLTSGRSGDGPVADELRAEIELQQARLDGLVSRREAQQLRVDALADGTDDLAGQAEDELVILAAQRQELGQRRLGDLDELRTRTAGADGLLMRIEALEWLTRNDSTVGGAAGGLTTVGIAVWLVRLWVLVLDAIPIGFKVLLSLRSQRPYDAILAAKQAAEVDLARSMTSTGAQLAAFAQHSDSARSTTTTTTTTSGRGDANGQANDHATANGRGDANGQASDHATASGRGDANGQANDHATANGRGDANGQASDHATANGRGDTNGQANGSGERAVISDIARTGDGEGHAPAVTGEHAAVRGARYLNRSAESLGRFTRPD